MKLKTFISLVAFTLLTAVYSTQPALASNEDKQNKLKIIATRLIVNNALTRENMPLQVSTDGAGITRASFSVHALNLEEQKEILRIHNLKINVNDAFERDMFFIRAQSHTASELKKMYPTQSQESLEQLIIALRMAD